MLKCINVNVAFNWTDFEDKKLTQQIRRQQIIKVLEARFMSWLCEKKVSTKLHKLLGLVGMDPVTAVRYHFNVGKWK